ncbi:MAG: ABC transporter permease [Patescibacteria group bacterium]
MLKLFTPFTSHKYLLFQLTQKEIKARYKQSIVGYAWVLLNPIALLAIYSFVFSIVFRFPTNDVPYPVFLFVALLPWIFFQTSIQTATNSLVSHAELLKKVAFPREVIPYAVVLGKLVDFAFAVLIFFVFVFFFDVQLHLTALWFIPLFTIHILLCTGVSLFLAAANLLYRDVQYLTGLLLLFWFYASPIVYPMSLVPEQYLWLYKLNPVVGLTEAYRSLLFGYPVETTIVWWAIGVSISVFIFGFVVFKKLERVFADLV